LVVDRSRAAGCRWWLARILRACCAMAAELGVPMDPLPSLHAVQLLHGQPVQKGLCLRRPTCGR
jgi:hypothetical protein